MSRFTFKFFLLQQLLFILAPILGMIIAALLDEFAGFSQDQALAVNLLFMAVVWITISVYALVNYPKWDLWPTISYKFIILNVAILALGIFFPIYVFFFLGN